MKPPGGNQVRALAPHDQPGETERILRMKTLLILCAAVALLTGCTANDGPTRSTEGARSPLANPADNTLNSPVTGPSSAGLPGGPIGSPPNGSTIAPVGNGLR